VFEENRIAVYAHIFGSATALVIGLFQFSMRIRSSYPGLHRWLDRLYVGPGIIVGGVSGLYMAYHAFGGNFARLGFALLALIWFYSGLRALLAIRTGNVSLHRRWMVRGYALTFAA